MSNETSLFFDEATINVRSGDGGHGLVSFRREKFVPRGGPAGGNGGKGGDVILRADKSLNTLLAFKHQVHFKAEHGGRGGSTNKQGKTGADCVVPVPAGTAVFLRETDELIADLIHDGQEAVIARGGRGGRGNAAFKTARNTAPKVAEKGEPGEEHWLELELKLVADVGIIGVPNAGKSTLLSVVSAARPKIADYPFTTLVPNLGVVQTAGDVFTIADVPGLIPGASTGRGLGLEFLRHLERCAVLAHVVDCATLEPGRDPISDIEALEAELAAYQPALDADHGLGELADRPRVVILNKVDVPDAADLADLVEPELAQRGWPVFRISAVTHQGLRELTFALARMVREYRESQPEKVARRPIIRPKAVDETGFTVTEDPETPGGFVVRGTRPERWIAQTQFDNDEAVGYLADRLNRLGVEDELMRLGAQPGAPVTIGAVTFDWEPSTPMGDDVPITGRGTDIRLDRSDRVGAAERKQARRLRRGLHEDSDGDSLDHHDDDQLT